MTHPFLHITAEPAVPEELIGRFGDYALSHPEDVRVGEQAAESEPITLHLAATGDRVVRERGPSGLKVTVPVRLAQNELAVRVIREMAHGLNFVPMLYSLAKHGVLSLLAAGPVSLLELAGKVNAADPARNLGYLYSAAKLLALQTWAQLEGRDEHTVVRLTESGRCANAILREHWETYTFVVGAIRNTQRYARLFRERDLEPQAVVEFQRMVELFERGWDLPMPHDGLAGRVLRQMRRHLDGTAITVTGAGLAMPVYDEREGKQWKKSPGFFEPFASSNALALDAVVSEWNPSMLELAIRLFQHEGTFLPTADGQLRLSPKGRVFVDAALPAYCTLPVSYLKMYERIDDLLFGDPDPLGVGEDKHIDRLMNIWGIENAVSLKRAAVVCREILHHIFDELPLEQQPLGLSDMGCGAGGTLRQMAEYVIHKTRRGQHLDTHPLFVVAADHSPVSRATARQTLSALEGIRGVHWAVVFGDVTDPEGYDTTLRGLGWSTRDPLTGASRPVQAADLLHSMFHLTHERTIRVPDDQAALELLQERLARVNRRALAAALSEAGGEAVRLPDSLEELLRLVSSQFQTSFAQRGRLVSALRVAADLVGFLERWAANGRFGLVIIELHSPRPQALAEKVPSEPSRWMRTEKLGHTCWSNQTLSDQYVMPYVEHALCAVLAGLELVDGRVHGGGLFTQQVKQYFERSSAWYRSAATQEAHT